jgi:hypothetical protein
MNRKEASPKSKRSRKLVDELVDSEEEEEAQEERVGADGAESDVEDGDEQQEEEGQDEESAEGEEAEDPLPAEVQSFMEQDDAGSVLSLLLNSIGANSRARKDEDEEAADVTFDQLLYAAVANNSCKYVLPPDRSTSCHAVLLSMLLTSFRARLSGCWKRCWTYRLKFPSGVQCCSKKARSELRAT